MRVANFVLTQSNDSSIKKLYGIINLLRKLGE